MTFDQRWDHLRPDRTSFGPVCLVVGGAGFLGRALVRALLERGFSVRAFDRRPAFEKDGRVKFFTGDIRDHDAVRRATQGCSTVFHTAAVLNFLGVCKHAVRREVADVNVGGTRNVIAACEAAGASRLVYTSTNTVCFDPRPVLYGDESKPYSTSFIDIYGETKTEAEKAVLAADRPGSLRTVAIRPAGLWGPGPGCYMVTKFVEELAGGKFVAIVGNGKSLADNTHVDNLVFAEFLAAEKLIEAPDVVGGQAYFVTDEEPMNLIDWFSPLFEELGYKRPKISIPVPLMYWTAYLMEWLHRFGGPRPLMTRLEVHNLTTDFIFRTDRARRELGYRPLVRHVEGLRECVPHCREALEQARRKKNRESPP
jgi:3beta-hydroxy-delta5-steroid dehydrogenase/steroid delta-isomerase